jgi:hypothetical protein
MICRYSSALIFALIALTVALPVAASPRNEVIEHSTKDWREQVSAISGVPKKDHYCLDWVDLIQSPGSIAFQNPTHTNDCLGGPYVLDTPYPAIFVSWRDGEIKYAAALIYEGAVLKRIWQAQLSGPGFQAINDINIGPEKTNNLLDIVINMTSLPQEGEMPSMPGPPQEFRFKFDGTVYK